MSAHFEIQHALDKSIKTYSKGMKQRIGFCAATLHRPKLLIMDEPLSGLDPYGRLIFKNKIKKINQNGVTVLLTSHILDDLQDLRKCSNFR